MRAPRTLTCRTDGLAGATDSRRLRNFVVGCRCGSVGRTFGTGVAGGSIFRLQRRRASLMHLEALQEIALRVSGERTVNGVLRQIVDGLARQPGVALARVWVVSSGDLCDSCYLRSSCADRTACLHLAASAGASLAGESWSRTDGQFRRIPFGHTKVGSIAANRTGLLLADPSSAQWARPEWVRYESIQSFAGQPLVFRDETLGALAVFRRQSIDDQEFRWLRMFADQAASAIANARAFS